MFHFIVLFAFGISVLMLGAERNYKGVRSSVLSIGVERYCKITEYISPPERIHPNVIYTGPRVEPAIIQTRYPPPSRPWSLELPLDHSACKNCTFSRSCTGLKQVEFRTKDLVLYHHPHESAHKSVDPALVLWLGVLVVSICIAGSGIFWDKTRSVFARFRDLALARGLDDDEQFVDENESHDEMLEPCKRCANHWVSDAPPLNWIDQYTMLQKEYNDMKAKKRVVQARLRGKSLRINELAWRNVSLRSKVSSYRDMIRVLGEKLKDLDNCVENMRQYYKMAMVFEYIEDAESVRIWEQHLNRFRGMAHLPSLSGIFPKDLAIYRKVPGKLTRKVLPPRPPMRPPNQNGMFP